MNTKADIESFYHADRIAIIGLSRNPKSFSRTVMREFQKRDYTLVGINPHPLAIEGVECFAKLEELTKPADAVLVLLPPDQIDAALQDCLKENIESVWVRGIEGNRSINESLVKECCKRSMNLVDGYCPLMFLEGAGFPHNLHRTVARWLGRVPRE